MARTGPSGQPGGGPNVYETPKAFTDNWSRAEFVHGARTGLRDALAVTLLSRVVGGAVRRRGR